MTLQSPALTLPVTCQVKGKEQNDLAKPRPHFTCYLPSERKERSKMVAMIHLHVDEELTDCLLGALMCVC